MSHPHPSWFVPLSASALALAQTASDPIGRTYSFGGVALVDSEELPAVDQLVSRLIRAWGNDIRYCSSIKTMRESQKYARIVALGAVAIDPILRHYREDIGMHFLLLQEITGEQPVPRADFGDMEAIREAWLQWGETQNDDGRERFLQSFPTSGSRTVQLVR